MTTPTPPTNLETLLEAIRAGAYTEQEMVELPTYGGEEPASTDRVWSWDESRVLVGLCASDMRIVARDVTCECGHWSGEACEWSGPREETIVVEFMPAHLRDSHRAAGNSGSCPLNGAERIRVERSCAERMLAHDADWVQVIT